MAPTTAEPVKLDENDPRVRTARGAEQSAYEYYGLDRTEHYIELDEYDTRMRAVEVGEGPPLVLINGGEGKGMMWLPLLPELDGYTRYVVDRPGGGLSDGIEYRSVPLRRLAATSTEALFDHFELEQAPVIGNSMGGLWTLRFTIAYPDRVSAIGLLGCPAVYPGTSAPLPMRLGSISFLSGVMVENMMQPNEVDGVRDAWKFLGQSRDTRARLPDEFAEAWFRMDVLPTYKPTWVGILQTVLRLRGANPDAAFTPEELRSIEVPVTLLWGSEDPFGSVEKGRAGAELFPDAEFHEVGTGHLPWLDAPERCGALLREFLDRQKRRLSSWYRRYGSPERVCPEGRDQIRIRRAQTSQTTASRSLPVL